MKTSVIFSICAFLAASFQTTGQPVQKQPVNETTVLRLPPAFNNPRNSEGDFITLKDGRILFVYTHYTGNSSNDGAPAYLAGRYSADHGVNWGKDVSIIENEGKLNIMSVSLLRLQNGKIALFYLRKNSETDCIPMIRTSADEAKTWSTPSPCISPGKGYFVLNNNRVIQMRSGRLLFAVSRHAGPEDSVSRNEGRLWAYHSDDNGGTWNEGNEVPNPDGVLIQEPGIIELKNGQLLMFMRTNRGVQYFSYSGDMGINWSAVVRSEIKSPLSPVSMTRIPFTGDLILIWNDNGIDQNRTPLNIAISRNEGKSWIKEKAIENNPKGSYCYAAIHFSAHHVLISYFDWTMRQITIKRLDLKWIYK